MPRYVFSELLPVLKKPNSQVPVGDTNVSFSVKKFKSEMMSTSAVLVDADLPEDVIFNGSTLVSPLPSSSPPNPPLSSPPPSPQVEESQVDLEKKIHNAMIQDSRRKDLIHPWRSIDHNMLLDRNTLMVPPVVGWTDSFVLLYWRGGGWDPTYVSNLKYELLIEICNHVVDPNE
ncbi:hypothetical protein Tco_1070430 [Tanacetum coccineum]|uniref:Uncharacterized protein n=1 Tax=Tanacetum coccineum TaxID=301880 RepID=A0ABQ5HLC7_9ASTR